MARFCPLFSGSSGNSYYIGSAGAGILIDAGRSAKQLIQRMELCKIDPKTIQAIFVTHEHSDHVSGLRVLASRLKVPVYASNGTLGALENLKIANGSFRALPLDWNGTNCAGMRVTPFHIPHDCAEGVGYRVETSDGRTAAFATDLGHFTEEVRCHIMGADLVVLESNHDVGMLQNGPYPYSLKKRILSDTGHLSNIACADAISELVRMGAARFFLAHLSRENNTPEIALQTTLCALTMEGMNQGTDFELSVAPRENPGDFTVF
ncbi:MBL fold metallo-hydrolase [Caproicibacterium sp. NSD3]